MRTGVAIFAVTVSVAAAGGIWASYAPRGEGTWTHPTLDDDAVERLRIERPDDHWEAEGFVHMTTPLLGPTQRDLSSRVDVWLRLPDDATIGVDERGALVLPEGTEADRVELLRVDGEWTVGDVRGARLGPEGLRILRLLRPERPGPGSPLVGYAWPENRPALGHRAHASLADLVRTGGGLAAYGPRTDLDAVADLLVARSGCVRCHARARGPRRFASEGGPMRPTDAAGFYSVRAVLSDASPLERYRPREQNVDRPHVTITCPSGTPVRDEDGRGGLVLRCPEGAVPVGAYDLSSALAEDDPHARAVCDARRYLFAHMDEEAQRLWDEAMAPCLPEQVGDEGD